MKHLSRVRGSQSRFLVALMVAAGALVVAVPGVTSVNVAGAVTATLGTTTTGFYLDLGGSASVGEQPTLSDPKGQPTTEGYANDVVKFEATRGVTLQLTQLGCPGESTQSMLNGGDHCYQAPDTQFTEAMAFLRSHYNDEGIVTIDIGFNNVRRCFNNNVVDFSCVTTAIAHLTKQLPTILSGLDHVAGPGVTFVGLGHYDPFLADALLGPVGTQFAQQTAEAMGHLNSALLDAYSDASIPMATVGNAFDSRDVGEVMLHGVGMVPDNVAETCDLTWMCTTAPFGPNIHPNEVGYSAIAASIESELKAPW
jgi:hypothetical protein